MTDPRISALRSLLDAYRPADDREAVHLERIRRLLETREQPFDRDGFDPGHITASGFVTDRTRARLLLIHHRRLDIWIQPGGHVDPSDAGVDAAARREIAEETGLTDLEVVPPGVIDVDVHRYPARPGGDPAHQHFDIRFGYIALEGRLDPNDEVHAARWVAASDLPGLGVDESVLRPARKLLATP